MSPHPPEDDEVQPRMRCDGKRHDLYIFIKDLTDHAFLDDVRYNGRIVRNGFAVFFVTLIGLAIIRLGLGFVSVPKTMLMPANLFITALFIALPIYAVFKAGTESWTVKLAGSFVAAGLFVHFGLALLVRSEMLGMGMMAAVAMAISQTGFFLWCVGLGAMLALFLKDRNLLIPVSIFLVAFDIFLVLTPMGVTQQVMKAAPGLLPAVAYQVPAVSTEATGAVPRAFGYIGPADFLFMGMFFVALKRFELRSRDTALWLVPAVLVYLLLSLVLPAIPLLVPIGLTVLLVNIREFKMTREEKMSTVVVAVFLAALLCASWLMPRRPAGPGTPVDVQVVPESADSPALGEAVPVPSQTPTAPGSRPGPP